MQWVGFVKVPVGIEIPTRAKRSQFQDRLCTLKTAAGAGDVRPVVDQMTAGTVGNPRSVSCDPVTAWGAKLGLVCYATSRVETPPLPKVTIRARTDAWLRDYCVVYKRESLVGAMLATHST